MSKQVTRDSRFDRVLLATDGTAGADHVTEFALELARLHDAAVHALYVVERRSSLGHFDLVVERREKQGETAVEAVEERAQKYGIPVTKAFRYGIPHDAIRQYAVDHDVDIIVLGTASRSGLKRLVKPRSTTEYLVERPPSPVVVAGGNDREPVT